MEKENREFTLNQIESMISLTNQQLKFAVKVLIDHNDAKKETLYQTVKRKLQQTLEPHTV